jgi:hypothetical protein
MKSNAILKEFDLDAPTLPREARQSFRHQTRCVTALYERVLKPFRNHQKAWKVLVEVVPVVAKHHARELLGVLTIQVQGSSAEFLDASDSIKPQIALDWLASGAVEIAKAHDWPIKPFQDAAAAVIEANFVNKWTWKINFWNKSRTLSCDIEIEHALHEVRIAAIFKNSDGLLVGKSPFCSTSPSEFAFVPLLGKVRWLEDRQVELASKDGKHRWLCSL